MGNGEDSTIFRNTHNIININECRTKSTKMKAIQIMLKMPTKHKMQTSYPGLRERSYASQCKANNQPQPHIPPT